MALQRFKDGSGNIVTVEQHINDGVCVGVMPISSHPVGTATPPSPVHKAVAEIGGVKTNMNHLDVVVTKADGSKSVVAAATFAATYTKIDG